MRIGFPSFTILVDHVKSIDGITEVNVLRYIPHEWGLLQTVSTSRGYSIRLLECLCLNNHTYREHGECWIYISWKKNQLDLHDTEFLGYYNGLQLCMDREVDCVLH